MRPHDKSFSIVFIITSANVLYGIASFCMPKTENTGKICMARLLV